MSIRTFPFLGGPLPPLLVLAGLALSLAWAEAPPEAKDAKTTAPSPLPSGFVYLDEVIPGIVVELRYATAKNFVGARIDGYEGSRAILTRQAAEALRRVQDDLSRQGLGLKVYDAYRPRQAVAHFVRWAQAPGDATKADYYPQVKKQDLFRQGYIARHSGHSRGSTVDLTLVKLPGGTELPMGTPFDFLDPRSAHASKQPTAAERANRAQLRAVMEKHGFRSLPKEWWHYRFGAEPFPKTYFSFPVK